MDFPKDDSVIRLIGSILIDIHNQWISNHRDYI